MPWIRQSPEEVDALFAGLRARDPFGHRLHLGAALAGCFFAGFPTTWLEWAWWPALAVCAVRLISHHRILGPLFWELPVRLTVAWVAWGALSLVWTAGTQREWLHEWGVARSALLILALWPVMNERRWLIAALAAGVAVGNLSQLGHAIGKAAGIEWLVWPRLEGRNSGWWDPVVGGSILCAALGLHLSGSVLGQGVRQRTVGAVMCLVTVSAIAATGTRGAWIGAAGIVCLVMVVAGLRWWRASAGSASGARHAGAGRILCVTAVLAAIGGAGVWLASGETVSQRVRETRQEFARAMDGDYSTFTGARLAMWGWAGRAFWSHPGRGVGVGGYRAWAETEAAQRGAEQGQAPRSLPHDHAHSMAFHAAAVTGIVGVGLLGGLLLASVWNGLREFGGSIVYGYDAAPAMALLGLACAGMFDSIQVNQQTAYWMWLLVALCMRRRPRLPSAAAGEGGRT